MTRWWLMSLVGLMWLAACRPRASSEPPAGSSESEPPPASEPWLYIEGDSDPGLANTANTPNTGPCTTGPEDLDGFMDEDNCNDPDNDGDGVRDVDDMCPNDPEDFDGFQDEDGCHDMDPSGP
ncbi:OmpA domain protein [Enhygromyxa salina]|uniref:OmpA domain protein n=1 Tax=Enhygromyxa salina TaxID=215803 RepID=A0A0C1ZK27_9BACT|nr:hypothetical protein [Enhygromyxa salina]KIG17824.1 OmpA domain protein [Enhygromyxa salina]